MKPHLILGNQLFARKVDSGPYLMIESRSFVGEFKYHKLRLLHQFVAMREYAEDLVARGARVHYVALGLAQGQKFLGAVGRLATEDDFFKELSAQLKALKARALSLDEIPDLSFKSQLQAWADRREISIEWVPSKLFLNPESDFQSYLGRSKKPFMKTYYERARRMHQVLVDKKGEPIGGRWSFDTENRKKLPNAVEPPPTPRILRSKYEDALVDLIEIEFKEHPGSLIRSTENSKSSRLWLPYHREGAIQWLKLFLKERLRDFGPYEDALTSRSDLVFHSGLSPLMNLGLLTPQEVLEAIIEFGTAARTPMESLEGLIRQILGWREFVRGIHVAFGTQQAQSNFFGHERRLTQAWYEGTTGLFPLDQAIQKTQRLAYNHHIERLMVIGNAMLLSEIHPREVYRWFMEMYLDSYEWVMGPNVFGMSQFSDGGIFATKPYISGSNYILKMSDYAKGEWCEIWDALYWSFIGRNADFFSKNPRLSMMSKLYQKMDSKKRTRLLRVAADFKDQFTL